jgi:3-oxoadipate CoA-transferase beta subunit
MAMLNVDCVQWTRSEMAANVATDIPEGWIVNLGIGIPTQVAENMTGDREVIFHAENGILGYGPLFDDSQRSPWLINPSKCHVALRPGGAYLDHADSFALIRGGHLDLCVLGAFEVSANGDLANWMIGENDPAPGIGGAMDLASSTRRIWVVMEHTTRTGAPRLVRRCQYPLTAPSVVSRIYTDVAILDVIAGRFVARRLSPGMTLTKLQGMTGAPVVAAEDIKLEVLGQEWCSS